ncbi:transport-associated protein [Thalassoporum mexicanum PCC 7367]|uniref:BON domain-containing protein n=1 Tax=Thalassoporum mexicanum TaxID=3457544 RepID=UPI00029FE0AA|nr:BON domain-containing protein [Pseudanabaena sp. PCC 7367]AFY68827.1 transport-associated protein [Pseudanabaena sp. PCC 7367]
MTSPNSNPDPGNPSRHGDRLHSINPQANDANDANDPEDINPLSGLIGTLSDLQVVKMQQRQRANPGQISPMPAPELNADSVEFSQPQPGDRDFQLDQASNELDEPLEPNQRKQKAHPYTNLVKRFRANSNQVRPTAQASQHPALTTEPEQPNPFESDNLDSLADLDNLGEQSNGNLPEIVYQPNYDRSESVHPQENSPLGLEDLEALGDLDDLGAIDHLDHDQDSTPNAPTTPATPVSDSAKPIEPTQSNSTHASTDSLASGALDALFQDLDLGSAQTGFEFDNNPTNQNDQNNAQITDQLTDQLSNELDDLLNGLNSLGNSLGAASISELKIEPEAGDRPPANSPDQNQAQNQVRTSSLIGDQNINNPPINKQPKPGTAGGATAQPLLNEAGEPIGLLRDLLGSAAEDEVSLIEQRLAQITNKVEQLDYQINTPPDTSQIDGQFANIGGQLAEIDGQFANLENQLESRLATLQNTIQNHPKIIELDGRLGDLQSVVADRSALEALDRQVELINQEIAQIADIKLLKQQLESLSQNVYQRQDIDMVMQKLLEVLRQHGNYPKRLALLKRRLVHLEQRINEPQELIELLLPIVNELLRRKISMARDEFAKSLATVVDEMIHDKIEEDREAMSIAIAPILAEAIIHRSIAAPGEFASAIAPELDVAIREQIKNNANSMVDALYPIIGNTIAKYMVEAIRVINEKIENAFSPEGIMRKIRAKAQGVSEAELIFQSAMPSVVRAAFLIHKESGLVIAETQPDGEQQLESDMLGGMLTAIRSFVNDWVSTSEHNSELDEIDYGRSKIMLEVAGFCYLAVVVEGESGRSQIAKKMRQVMATIIQKYSRLIENFEGDPTTIPRQVKKTLDQLLDKPATEENFRSPLYGIGILILLLLGLATIPWWFTWRRAKAVKAVDQALDNAPALSVYNLDAEIKGGELALTGRVPTEYLRAQAEDVATQALLTSTTQTRFELVNNIVAVEVPPDPTVVAQEVERTAASLNQFEAIAITVEFNASEVNLAGTIGTAEQAQLISQSFAQIPGVTKVVTSLQVVVPEIPTLTTKIFFALGDSTITTAEDPKIAQVKNFLVKYPNYKLRIIGSSDPVGSLANNEQLAWDRAETVKNALIAQAIDPQRLTTAAVALGSLNRGDQPSWLDRRVEFEVIAPSE